MMLLLRLGLLLLLLSTNSSYAFEWSTGGRPAIDRRAIAGVWSLRPQAAYPMKEFTVYPKKTKPSSEDDSQQLLLMLKEDGSFQQCKDDEDNSETFSSGSNSKDHGGGGGVDVDASWSKFQKAKTNPQNNKGLSLQTQLLQGTWDLVDGKLILAADRVAPTASDDVRRASREKRQASGGMLLNKNKDDTLLVGRVVANYETRLKENPVLRPQQSKKQKEGKAEEKAATSSSKQPEQSRQQQSASSSSSSSSSSSTSNNKSKTVELDTHLSVPKGSVKVGRFFYPRNHPSFFEQPMFQPKRQGSFSLRQVLGSLNTALDADEPPPELFQRSDFYNKTFTLTSHPISYKPKGKMRWSIRQNKMVQDPPSQAALDAAQRAQDCQGGAGIRAMLVQFHANNTFSTLAGLGESTILRGKFDIIGHNKDQLWMQIWRFGFGRSVSGSVYSEGRMLTQEDAKTYWGTITRYNEQKQPAKQQQQGEDKVQQQQAKDTDVAAPSGGGTNEMGEGSSVDSERLQVKGSVMSGWGIEPLPEARFIMREATNEDDVDEEEDDDEDDEGISLGGGDDGSLPSLDSDGIDWSSDEDSFQ